MFVYSLLSAAIRVWLVDVSYISWLWRKGKECLPQFNLQFVQSVSGWLWLHSLPLSLSLSIYLWERGWIQCLCSYKWEYWLINMNYCIIINSFGFYTHSKLNVGKPSPEIPMQTSTWTLFRRMALSTSARSFCWINCSVFNDIVCCSLIAPNHCLWDAPYWDKSNTLIWELVIPCVILVSMK